MDAAPQRLKPLNLEVNNGGAEAPPLQRTVNSALKLRSFED